jgi:hypothetical protein
MFSTINVKSNSVSIETKPNSDGNLEWKITVLTKDGNQLTTCGIMTITKPIPTIKQNATKTLSNYAPNYPLDEKIRHTNHIKELLIKCDTTRGLENKKNICRALMEYIGNEALDYTLAHDGFKNQVIKKCNEFKEVHPEFPDLIEVCNDTLRKLGISVTTPVTTPVPIETSLTPARIYDSEHDNRVELMKKILIQRNNTYNDVVIADIMDKYYDWADKLLPSRSLNRYRKMYQFVNNIYNH